MGKLEKYGCKVISRAAALYLDEIPDREIFAEAARRKDSAKRGLCTYCAKRHATCNCRMKRVGKRAAGRLLDGVLWDDMPQRQDQ